jgi:polygalacturonase
VAATSAGEGNTSVAAAVTVAATAYTVVNPGSVYNVKTGYGATGNGSTDDTAAIQNAINAAAAAGGGLAEVPAGTYMVNLGYQMGSAGLLMKPNVTLQLDAGATLKAMAGAPSSSDMVLFSGGSNMNLVGPGALDGNKGVIGLDEGIKNVCILGGSNIVLAGFTSQNAPGDGIYIGGYPSGAGVGLPVSNVQIYGVTCTANGRNGMSPVGCDGLVVRDSVFSDQTGANPMNGIDIEPVDNQAPTDYAIFNCQLTGNKGGGIQSGADDSGDNATFTNMTYAFNAVSGNGNYGIEAQDGAEPVNILYNTVSGTTASYEFPGYGIMTRGDSGIQNVTILGNSVTTSASDGMNLASASNSTCTGNSVTDNGGEGINNQSGSGMAVSGNVESGNAGGD